MFKVVFALFLLFCLIVIIDGASYTHSDDIRHFELNGDKLIITSLSNFALSNPFFYESSSNWKTLDLNENIVTLTSVDCKTITKEWKSLSDNDRSSIMQFKARIEEIDKRSSSSSSSSSSSRTNKNSLDNDEKEFLIRYSADGQNMKNNFSKGNNGTTSGLTMFQSKKHSMFKYGETLSVGKFDSPDSGNIARIIFDKSEYICIYSNKEIQMKPINCVTEEEQQLMDNLEDKWNRAQMEHEEYMRELHERLNKELKEREKQEDNFQQQLFQQEKELEDKLRLEAEHRQRDHNDFQLLLQKQLKREVDELHKQHDDYQNLMQDRLRHERDLVDQQIKELEEKLNINSKQPIND